MGAWRGPAGRGSFQLYLVAVGRLRPALRPLCDDYLARIGRYTRVEEREVREAGRARTPEVARREEGARLLERVPPGARVVALAREGIGWSSVELAVRVERWRVEARPVAFVIGGATGLSGDILERADVRWSLGPLTLPHELARVVVAEQVYRAFTILGGERYHKGGS